MKRTADATEQLLLDLANLPELRFPRFHQRVEVLARRHADVFNDIREISLFAGESKRETGFQRAALGLRQHLRAAWDAPDQRHRDWYIFKLRALYKSHLDAMGQMHQARYWKEHKDELIKELPEEWQQMARELPVTLRKPRQSIGFDFADMLRRAKAWGFGVEPPPPLTPFEEVMFHFQRIGHLARHCANPECRVTPYFFAMKKGQKFCSTGCAKPAQRESKRTWWVNNRGKQSKNTGDTNAKTK